MSPSGNGIKALIKVPLVVHKEKYKEYYLGLLQHFNHLNPDSSTKDMNRLCFESYDPELYLNESSDVFKIRVLSKHYPKVIPKQHYQNENETLKISWIYCWWKNKYSFHEGSRNTNLYILACALSEYGVSMHSTLDFFLACFQEGDFKQLEIKKICISAYKNTNFNSKSFTV